MWLADHGPDRQQHALALVVARAVLVRLAEVADGDGPVDRADDVAEGDRAGLAGQHVAAAHAPLRAHQAGALEREEDLLEVGLGQARALGDVAHRGRARPRRRAARARAGRGWRSHLGSTPSRAPLYEVRGAEPRRRWFPRSTSPVTVARRRQAQAWTNSYFPTTAGPASPTSFRRCSAPRRRARLDAGGASPTRPRWCCSSSTAWAGSSSRPGSPLAPDHRRHGRRSRSQRWRPRPRPPP